MIMVRCTTCQPCQASNDTHYKSGDDENGWTRMGSTYYWLSWLSSLIIKKERFWVISSFVDRRLSRKVIVKSRTMDKALNDTDVFNDNAIKDHG